ncbi:MAG: right-handed parallel beta-helix repeat-containing protein [Calditrichaceae bacterium]
MKQFLPVLIILLVSLVNAQWVVNTEDDIVIPDDGLISLREAVTSANETAGQQTITFDQSVFLPGADRKIYLKSALSLTDDDGVKIDGSNVKVTLDGSQADSNAVDFRYGLLLRSGNNQVTNIYMQNFKGAAVVIDSSETGNNTIGPENSIYNGLAEGIKILSSNSNTVTGNYIWANDSTGIEVNSSGNNTFRDNYIAVNEEYGIHLVNDSGSNLIEHNQIFRNYYGGIRIVGGEENDINSNDIGEPTDNSVNQFAQTSPEIPDLASGTYEKDFIILISEIGIQLLGVQSTEIKSNTLSQCGVYGVLMDALVKIDSSDGGPDTTYYFPEDIMIESNFFENNLDFNIYAYNTLSMTVKDNFMQLSGGGVLGQGLTSYDPQVVGRDSLELGDHLIKDNIFSFIMPSKIKSEKVLRPAPTAVMMYNLKSATVTGNDVLDSYGGIYTIAVTDVFINSNTFNTLSYNGILIDQSDNCQVEDNQFTNIGSDEMIIRSASENTDNQSAESASQNYAEADGGYAALTCNNVISLDVTLNRFSEIGGFGMYLSYCTDAQIENNTVSECNMNAVFAFITKQLNISNNQFPNSGGAGYAAVMMDSVNNCLINKNEISDPGFHGIQTYRMDTLMISDNQILSCSQSGIYSSLSGFQHIMNNYFYGNTEGISIITADSSIIENNTFSKNQSNGLRISTIGFGEISNTYFIENFGNGLDIEYTDTCRITNNYIIENGTGYYTYSPAGQVLRLNTIQNNSNYGAYCSTGKDSLDARQNYWGSENGPALNDSLYPGMSFGDRINEYVQYLPFLTEPTVEFQLSPEVDYIDPAESEVDGGGTVKVFGKQFMPEVQVFFGEQPAADVQYLSSTVIKCIVPSGEGGYVDFIVMNADGYADTLAGGFYYIPVVSIEDEQSGIPDKYALHANYPNPFNPVTTIRFDLPEAADVQLDIFNALGEKLQTLAKGVYPAGAHSIRFNGRGIASGVYYYRIKAGDYTAVRRMLLMK